MRLFRTMALQTAAAENAPEQPDAEHERERDRDHDREREAAGLLENPGPDIGAHHEQRTMREVHHVHDAENERESGGDQKQENAELNAVQDCLENQLTNAGSAPSSPRKDLEEVLPRTLAGTPLAASPRPSFTLRLPTYKRLSAGHFSQYASLCAW